MVSDSRQQGGGTRGRCRLGRRERRMSITCHRCGRDISEINLVDSPYPNDNRLYCLDCYAHLFPPGWTDEYQPLKDIDAGPEVNHKSWTAKCELCGGDLVWDG